MKKLKLWAIYTLTGILMASCGGPNGTSTGTTGSSTGTTTGTTLSSEKAITAFSIVTPAATGVISGTNIAVTVPYGTGVTALVAAFTTTGKSVSVGTTAQVSGTTANDFTGPLVYTVTAEDSTTQKYLVTVTVAPSTAKDITSFSFTSPSATATITGTNIDITVPYTTSVSNLVASFATSGASVKVGSTIQVSGTTVNNYTSPVVYTVTAANGTTKIYLVTVMVALNSAKDITDFSFTSPAVTGVITGTNIAVTVPYGTSPTVLIASFTTTGTSVKVGGAVQTNGTTPNNFTSPVTYTVTAANGTMKTYLVTVTVALNPAKDITTFSFSSPAAMGVITGTNISVIVPFATSVTALVASFTTLGTSVKVGGAVQTNGTTPNNFSSPVTYTATAADGTTKNYIVTVTVALNPAKALTSFSMSAGVIWTARGSSKDWRKISSSSDGTKLVAAAYGGYIFTSTNSGIDWTARDLGRYWISAASSSDGTKLVAVVKDGQIYTSTNSGLNWTAHETNRNWFSVASSADGTKLIAGIRDGLIYTSTDSGVTWTSGGLSKYWRGITSSEDGIKLVATAYLDYIYTSTNCGVNWTATASSSSWSGVASSADGTKIIAIASGSQIYTSIDSGATWTARESSRYWYGVASSADGTKLVAVVYGGRIYTSIDSGVTWMARETNRSWYCAASSADGTKLVAGVSSGQIYTSSAATGTVDEGAHTVNVTLPTGTAKTALVFEFATTGATVKVGSTVQVSGVTANDFTSPVTYTVTAADGTTQNYVVTVNN